MAPPHVIYRSVDRPDLTLEEDDVFACECAGQGCPDCRGHYVLHGFDGTRGLPVVVEDALRGEATPEPHEGTRPEASRGTRPPLYRAQRRGV